MPNSIRPILKPLFMLSFSASLLASSCSGKSKSLAVTEMKRSSITQRVTVAGMVVPKRKASLAPPYAGYIRKIFVEVGQNVREGDPIISIAQVIQQGGNEVYPLRAPFPGTVVQRNRTEGEYVEPSKDSQLVRIDDLTHLYVDADVPELELPKLKLGQPVIIKAAALGRSTSKGVIRQISLASRDRRDVGRGNIEFPIKIEITEGNSELRPGMSTVVDILAASRENVLTLGHEYMKREGDKFVAILEDGTRRELEVGIQNEEGFEIISGLQEGERVRRSEFAPGGPMANSPKEGKKASKKGGGGPH